MKNKLYTDSQFEKMELEVRKLLKEVGYKVDHEEVIDLAVKAGCKISSRNRVLFNDSLINQLIVRLLEQYKGSLSNDKEMALIHEKVSLKTSFGNIAPKFYNYSKKIAEGGNLENFIDLVKFAHSDKRINSINLPVSRQDIYSKLEQIDSLACLIRNTDKKVGIIDVTHAQAIPFIVEIGECLGLKPQEIIGPCNCINPPMHLGLNSAQLMLAKKPYHLMSMITPMPSLGGSGPVDIYGCTILGAAEIVGGLILSMIIDPDALLLGYIASGHLDMRSTVTTSASPESIRLDSGIYQLMDKCFGGGTRVGGRSFVPATRPGLQAVFEKVIKMVGYSAYVDANAFNYSGLGIIDNGSMVSPEQFLIDMEIMEAMNSLFTYPKVPENEMDAFTRISDEIYSTGGNFFVSDHTLDNYKSELWEPGYLLRLVDTRKEEEILDQCHSDYEKAIRDYMPASYPEAVLREADKIYIKAEQTLMK